MFTVAVIPARRGSRGLPGKHLRKLGGLPLIHHTVAAALAARRVDRVLVSTDDPAIARVARGAGAEVPFLRPAALAADDTPTLPVIRHAVEWVERSGQAVDLIVTLQPTSPLRAGAAIDEAIAVLERSGAQSLVSVSPIGLPISVLGWVESGMFHTASRGVRDPRRQAVSPGMRINGAIYLTRRALLAANRLLDAHPAAIVLDGDAGIDIDSMADLARARRAFRNRRA